MSAQQSLASQRVNGREGAWVAARAFSAAGQQNAFTPVSAGSPLRKQNKRAIVRRPRLSAVPEDALGFYGSDETGFEDLGIHPRIAEALSRDGLTRPARIQELSAPVILSGQDTVIAAETGSGKTLSYIAPIASLILRMKERQASMERPLRYHALVLCPNGPLCQQVASVIHSIKSDTGEPLLTAAQVNSSTPPPVQAPDFILATPAGLMSFLESVGISYGLLWTKDGMQARVKHVVLDEADLLLTPAFSKSVMQLLQLLKSGDRRKVEAKICQELDITEEEYKRLPRLVQQGGWKDGTRGLLAAGYRAKNKPSDDVRLGPYWRRQYLFVAATMPTTTRSDVGNDIVKLYPDAQWVATEALHTSTTKVTHSWIQVSEDTWSQQLVTSIKAAAAASPSTSSSLPPQSSSSLSQAIGESPPAADGSSSGNQSRSSSSRERSIQDGPPKVLVFSKDTATADVASELLARNNIKHVVYHKGRPTADNQAALLQMQEQSVHGEEQSKEPLVMVCTDAASRGIDIQGVTHVIQSDFASDTIAFLHRVGRTGRAGREGKVTSFYRESDLPLVEVIKSYLADGKPLEAAFSRARSFKRKYKRSGGQFVPRGLRKVEAVLAEEDPFVEADSEADRQLAPK